jgi:NAD(P)-dependent dehydrogenase (short-subunit alcohol dehydrogenase family)
LGVALAGLLADYPASGAIAIPVDVADPDSVTELVTAAQSAAAPLKVLHANAGIGIYADLEVMPTPDISRVLAVNLYGALLCCRAVLGPLRSNGGGAIVITSSVQANLSLPGCVAYAATKAGLIAAARTLAVEVGAHNIRVNCVSPGTIDTPMLERDMSGMDRDSADGFLDQVRRANALGRIGTAQEIAQAVAFLASDEASYITGTNLLIDGGFSAVKRF